MKKYFVLLIVVFALSVIQFSSALADDTKPPENPCRYELRDGGCADVPPRALDDPTHKHHMTDGVLFDSPAEPCGMLEYCQPVIDEPGDLKPQRRYEMLRNKFNKLAGE